MSATAIADVLRDYGVDLAYPDRRLDKARVVLEAGATAETFGIWCREVEVSCGVGDARVPRIIAGAILEGSARIKAAVADALSCAEARQLRADPRSGYGVADRTGPDLSDEARLARVAFCRVVADRKPPAEIAAELGVHVSRIADLVEQGRAMQAPRLPNQGPSRKLPEVTDDTREKSFDEMRRRSAHRIVEDRSKTLADLFRGLPRMLDALRSECAHNEGRVRVGGDLVRRGALAELEASGEWILGAVDGAGWMTVAIVPPAQRKSVVEQRKVMFQRDIDRRPMQGAEA